MKRAGSLLEEVLMFCGGGCGENHERAKEVREGQGYVWHVDVQRAQNYTVMKASQNIDNLHSRVSLESGSLRLERKTYIFMSH